MYELLTNAAKLSKDKPNLICAFISDKAGSSPRDPGSWMLVSPEGLEAGTIGGGAIEYLAIKHAQKLLASQSGDQVRYNLSLSEASNTGMACGGQNDVHFSYLDAEKLQRIETLLELLEKEGTDKDSYLIFSLDTQDSIAFEYIHKGKLSEGLLERLGHTNALKLEEMIQNKSYEQSSEQIAKRAQSIHGSRGETFCLGFTADDAKERGLGQPSDLRHTQDLQLFFSSLRAPSRVLIFGGGHVSQALTRVLSPLDLDVLVYEDRKEFADPKLFGTGTKTYVVDMNEIAHKVSTTDQDYLCVITRGHSFDTEVLAQTIRKPHAYLGCIGSKNKAAAVRKDLTEAGFSSEELEAIYCPIGLKLGNSTPEELAISIAAQILQHKSLGTCQRIL